MAEQVAPNEESTPSGQATPRLESVDALRGFDMLWIIGGASVARALEKLSPSRATQFLAEQLQHVTWEGFRCYDLIFPLFLFIVGISTVYSLDKALASGSRGQVAARIVRRSLLLFALGVFYSGGLAKPWPDIALGGVLQRIAACYLAAALVYCLVRRPGALLGIAAALLIGYWALVTYVPFPDLQLDKEHVQKIAKEIGSERPHEIAQAVSARTSGLYEEGRNLTNYLDFLYLPGRKAQTYYINEGLLSTLPSIALPLLGMVAAMWLRCPHTSPGRKVLGLIAAGAVCALLGWGWSWQFPVIKRIWSSSFVLLAAGYSIWLLAAFYYLIDVRQWRTWCRPFVWIGCNAITLYIGSQLLGFPSIAARLVGGSVSQYLNTRVATGSGDVMVALVGLALVVLLARFLYVRKIFIRV
ncbi:MAG: DUF1624 domain-containing protein [Planctomycetes bacterium]|nr:DUF1624 domain-containing protein [Planctomycetota bacterium]